MLVANTVLVNAVTTAADITSNPFRLKFMDRAGIQCVWTGTTNGAVTLQYSSDIGHEDGLTTDGITNWSTVTGSSIATGGAAGTGFYDITTAAKWVRVIYTRTNGTGLMTVTVNSKGAQ